MKWFFHISALQILAYLYLFLGFSYPIPSNIPRVASFQLFSHPACSLWHNVQLVHVQFKCVIQSPGCGIGIISIVFFCSHTTLLVHPRPSTFSVNYLQTVGKKYCAAGTTGYQWLWKIIVMSVDTGLCVSVHSSGYTRESYDENHHLLHSDCI